MATMLASRFSRTLTRRALPLALTQQKATASVVVVPTSRFLSTSPAEEATEPPAPKGWLGKLAQRFSIRGEQRRIVTAEMLFQAATRQANDPHWYGPGRIPRDFRSRHAMATMHLWFLHKRLIASNVSNGNLDEDTCLKIQEELFESFWNDTLCRLRAQAGVREMSVTKYLSTVQQYTFLHLFHYDHIFGRLATSESHLDKDKQGQAEGAEDDLPPEFEADVLDPHADLTKRADRIQELKKLIWVHVFARDPEAKECDDLLERLAWYVEMQYQNILVDWPGQYVEEARVGWVNLPDFSDLKDNNGKVLEKQPLNPDDVIPKPWLTNITLRGEYYYWNPTNGKSQWVKPTSAQG